MRTTSLLRRALSPTSRTSPLALRLLLSAALALPAAACSDDPAPAVEDAGVDLRQRDDASPDASDIGGADVLDDPGADLAPDATADAAPDLGPDAAPDASPDSSDDLAGDLATPDASDVASDAIPDFAADPDVTADTTDAGDEPDAEAGPAPRPGDIVIVEIGGNPVGTGDNVGEFFEIVNVSGRELALDGVTIAYHQWTASGSEPTRSVTRAELTTTRMLAVGERVILGPSGGHGFSTDVRYPVFEITNAESMAARVRLYTPSWDGTEPPAPAHLIDGVTIPAGTFGNDNRGRSWQLFPAGAAAPTAANNDIASNWCLTATSVSLEYAANNYGTPGAPNDCN